LFAGNDIISTKELERYKKQLKGELAAILQFWQQNTVDTKFGGFYGRLNNSNKIFSESPKGAVLNSRILWAFSAAYNLTINRTYLATAQRAFQFFTEYFIDKINGGVFWTVDYKGQPLDTKKQIYALSFAIYGLSEFYLAGKIQQAKDAAIELYRLIVDHSYDEINGGYIEALSADWKEIDDLRLSYKDANEKKSMNTHLHLLEALANLYRIWPNENLKDRIDELIYIFIDHIIDTDTCHLHLFFDECWNVKSNVISYGHDIEAAWLLPEACEVTGNKELIAKVKSKSIQLANAATEGLDEDGGMWYEYNPARDSLIKEKHSWPQAESMVGFFNAWQLTGDETYLQRSLNSWNFIKDHILDTKNGEWFWGVRNNYDIMNEDKVGMWKCPYHNSRACIELMKRIDGTPGN
jgi:cellobiose epimerase